MMAQVMEKATWAENAGEYEYAYGWGEDSDAEVLRDGRIFIRRYEHSYGEAPLHYGLTLVDAGRLEDLRSKIFDLKIAILGRLARLQIKTILELNHCITDSLRWNSLNAILPKMEHVPS